MDTTRERLIAAALYLFAEKGFAAASTRDISQRAGVNLAAIRYHFGDKGGLYRAVYLEPLADLPPFPHLDELVPLSLENALDRIYRYFLEPLKRGDVFRQVMKLHYREMIEPTGAWQQEIESDIGPQHRTMVHLLERHLKVDRPDAHIHRLAFSLFGQAVVFYVGQDVVDALQPSLLRDDRAISQLRQHLVRCGVAMVRSEQSRRRKHD